MTRYEGAERDPGQMNDMLWNMAGINGVRQHERTEG